MLTQPHRVRRPSLLLGLLFLLPITTFAHAQEPAVSALNHPLRLADCLAISQERQPSLAVARARLAAAQSKLTAIEALSGPAALLHHDIPVRVQQARLGVETEQADYARLQTENIYVVTRAYLSLQYARTQGHVLDELIDDLSFLRERVRASVEKKERKDWTDATVDLITLYLRRAQARRTEVDRGIDLSLAALREAMNLEPCVVLNIAEEPLPNPQVQVNRDEILAAAVARRGEAIEAGTASEAVALEVDAQGKVCRRGPVRTFAAGADLHARHVPQAIYGEEFRPGGIPLAMPTTLVGPRANRVESAQELSAQAAFVAQKTRNLIVLEVEEAYYSWREWSGKIVYFREAQRVGVRLGKSLREQFRGPISRVIEAALPETLLLAQAQTDYNEALYRHAIALANLERVTGGAFHAGLVNPLTPAE